MALNRYDMAGLRVLVSVPEGFIRVPDDPRTERWLVRFYLGYKPPGVEYMGAYRSESDRVHAFMIDVVLAELVGDWNQARVKKAAKAMFSTDPVTGEKILIE